MKRTKAAMLLLCVSSALLSSCYSDREYMRDMAQIEAQSKHQQEIETFAMRGPAKVSIELEKDGYVGIKMPNTPWVHYKYPSSLEAQEDISKWAIGAALAGYLGHELSGGSTSKTFNTTSNAGAAQ